MWIIFLVSLLRKNIEMVATDTWCICSPLGALGPYKRLSMCHSLITLAASRTGPAAVTCSLLPWCRRSRRIPRGNTSTSLRLMDIVLYPGCFPFLALLGLASIVSFFDTKHTNSNLSGQLHLYVAYFCATGHIHTMVIGGLLAMNPNAYSFTATRRNTKGIKPWHRREQS